MKQKIIIITLFCLFYMLLVSCSINAAKLEDNYAQEFADNVRCARGYKGKCWCFVASRRTCEVDSNGIGLTLVPDALCE